MSVGTDHHPFDRLLDWAAQAQRCLDIAVVAQCGATRPHDELESFNYLPAPELEARMRAADAVVCHGGPGTIGLCRSAGQRPIVVPRDPALGEHVDDHQIRYSTKLAVEGTIDLVRSRDELIEALASERHPLSADAFDVAESVEQFGALADALLAGELATRPWRRRLLIRRTV